MAYKCDNCGKGRVLITKQRHKKGVAGGKWKHRASKTLKIVLPNLHAYNGIFHGQKGKWRLCTKCLRRVKQENKPRGVLQKKTVTPQK